MILIGLGANLPGPCGAPEDTIAAAVTHLAAVYSIKILKRSDIWLTAPVPLSDQNWYRNAVIAVETALNRQQLHNALQKTEQDFGRVRSEKNAPRLLDLDLLCFNGEICADENLILPHPRMQERGFVLYPLRQVHPGWMHPVLNRSIEDFIDDLPPEQVVRPLQGKAA